MAVTEKFLKDITLAPYTSLGVGGAARYFYECRDESDVREALELAGEKGLPVQVLGGGSNLVFSDDGYEGLVLRVSIPGIDFREEHDGVEISAGAGVEWDNVVTAAVERGLRGVECLSGIPGSVGAAPIQNIGAYGQEVGDCLASVRCVDRDTLAVRHFERRHCGFGYRMSRFKAGDRDRYVITRVVLKLEKGLPTPSGYPDLVDEIQNAGSPETEGSPADALRLVRQAVLRVRKRKAMVVDRDDPNTRSVGSFFLNPVLRADAYETFSRRLKELGEALPPVYPAEDGVKVSAAWLVEHSGFRKGYRRGGAAISERHALALVNRGGGASQLLELAGVIEERVFQRFGIRLQKEPVVVP